MAKKLKEIRQEAERIIEGGVTRKSEIIAALPILIEIKDAITNMDSLVSELGNIHKKLSNACTDYAKTHPGLWDDGKMHVSQAGVMVGDVTIDGKTYHLACGYKGYERADGALMTQEFIETLPPNWRKVKNEISVTGVNDDNPTAEDLAKYGLAERPHNVWSERKDPKGID